MMALPAQTCLIITNISDRFISEAGLYLPFSDFGINPCKITWQTGFITFHEPIPANDTVTVDEMAI